MKLEEMKAIAEKRDRSFLNDSKKLWSPVEIDFCQTDADFIAMASKNWDNIQRALEFLRWISEVPQDSILDAPELWGYILNGAQGSIKLLEKE